MAKKSIIARENKRQILRLKYSQQRYNLKKIIKNVNLSENKRMDAQRLISKLPVNSSMVRNTKRCAVTGRAHSVYRQLGLCRNMIHKLVMSGKLPGIRKSSW
jgi:small subunit ribosomal protein S14